MHKELKGWLEWLGIEKPDLQALHGDASPVFKMMMEVW